MDTLDRYLVREFLNYFLLILLGLAALFVGVDFLTKFWDSKLPFDTVLQIYLCKIPGAIQQFVPVACLMGTLMVISTMSRQNEILALFAGGIGVLRIASTLVAVVAAMSTLTFLIFDPLMPALKKRQMLLENGLDPSQEYTLNVNRSGFWYRGGRVLYSVGKFTPETNTMEDVRVYIVTPSFYMLERIHAKEARYINDQWVLFDGISVAYPQEDHFPMATSFKERAGLIQDKPSDFKTLKVQEDTMRLKDLRHYISRNKNFGMDTTSQQVNYHERVATVFAPLILVLLGLPFGLKPLKTQSMPKSISFCFLIVFIYLLLSRMTLSVGKGGFIPPLLAAWAPNIIFLGIASFFMFRRQSV